jgi:hypothetical protein
MHERDCTTTVAALFSTDMENKAIDVYPKRFLHDYDDD